MSVLGKTVNLPVAIAVSGGTALLASYLYSKSKEGKHYPPGPTTLPIVGNLFQLSVRKCDIPGLFNEWANYYGAVYIVMLGNTRAVVLNTMPVICEALCEKCQIFSDRPNWLPLFKLVYKERGLEWQNGDPWKAMRQCVFGAFAGKGVGSLTLEQRIQKEANKVIKEFSKKEQDCCSFCPIELFHKAVTNIICAIVFGCRYKYKSGRFQKLICMVQELADCNVLDSTTFFPFLSSLPVPRLNKAVKNMSDLISFVEEEVLRHKESYNPACIRDFIDLYMKECASNSCLKDITNNLEVAIIDMFVCGSEPTSSALSWAILCMVAFPDVQERCHDEIDAVICERQPEMVDMCKLPFVQATLYEVLRRFTVLPLGVPHCNTQDVGIGGLCIPADSIIICNLQAVHLNDKYWTNPCDFDPERFLDTEDDDYCLKEGTKERFLPFGIGPRTCVGKELSWNILCLMFTTLLQHFDFQRGCECDMTKCFEGKFRYTFAPMAYKIKIRCH